MGVGASGEKVKTLQRQLVDSGYELPKYGVDGSFGSETKAALQKFQRARGIEPSGVVDRDTKRELGGPKKVGPKPGDKTKASSPRYDEMLADGVMEVTVAHGYTKDGSDTRNLPKIRANLKKEGLTRVDVANTPPAQLRRMGIDPKRVPNGVEVYHKPMRYKGKSANMVVRVMSAETPNAKAVFADAMKRSDSVQYIGHGRYGSGPDFDKKESMKGNYVIGRAYAPYINDLSKQQRGAGAPTDLAQGGLSKDYQLMAFYGCKTKHYVDDLRRVPNKDPSNLHILATNDSIRPKQATFAINRTIQGLARLEGYDPIVQDVNAKVGAPLVYQDGE